MKTAVITDSSSNLSIQYVNDNKNLNMIPLSISLNEKTYRDQVEIDYDTVYKNLDKTKINTNIPNLSDYKKTIECFINEGYTDILVITISSKLSCTFNAFKLISKEYDDVNIYVYDSRTLAMAQGYLVKEAIESIKLNHSIYKILSTLDNLRFNNIITLYTVDTLKYLRLGGKIGIVEKTIGDVLAIKPIISVSDEGVNYTVAKAIGVNRAIIAMRKLVKEKFGENLIDIVIHYGTNLEKAERISIKLRNEFKIRNINIVQLSPVLGVYTGPEIIGLVVKKLDNTMSI